MSTTSPAVPPNRTTWTDARLLVDLEPVVAREIDRHLGVFREWMPHEYVPWSQGLDFDGPLGGQPWDPAQSSLTEVGRTAMVVNLLTEDNLPSYHREIATLFGRDGAWGTWVHRWTAEEARHSMVMRDYLLTTRAVDPAALETARMTHMSGGFESDHRHSALRSIAYVAFQELATRISHRNTGRECGDAAGEQMLARIAADENLHMIFYRNLLAAAIEAAPDQGMRAVADVVTGFRMPGHGMPGFERAAATIALGGVYDLRIHHDDVLRPVLRHLKVLTLGGLGPDGQRAQTEIGDYLDALDAQARKFEERRAAIKARRAARQR
ncbi:acyl-ACP desaturase [Catenulispora subtropica]|uniref:Acyl-ACP desaturase n=1 Tax=Catenulispora subtropica TaxID=450798 RepID=A0ABN2R716_9ACTN